MRIYWVKAAQIMARIGHCNLLANCELAHRVHPRARATDLQNGGRLHTSADFRKTQRRRAELHSRSEAAVATIGLVFYVLGLAVAVSSPIVSRVIELAAH